MIEDTMESLTEARYRVVLHNDDFNTMEHVVLTLLKILPTLNQIQATEMMLEAHHQGSSVILTAPKLEAERYCDEFKQQGLSCVLAPEPCRI